MRKNLESYITDKPARWCFKDFVMQTCDSPEKEMETSVILSNFSAYNPVHNPVIISFYAK